MRTYIAIIVGLILVISFYQYKDDQIYRVSSSPAIASIKAMTVISDFEKLPTEPLEKGLYKSLGGTGSGKYGMSMYITDNTVTKTLLFEDSDLELKATANYTYDGSVIKYTNTQGDLMLFIAQGEPFIKRSESKFAIVGECSLEAEENLKGKDGRDTMCRNGVEITEFNKIKEDRVIQPMASTMPPNEDEPKNTTINVPVDDVDAPPSTTISVPEKE